jgi:hypothetical protein
MPADDCDLKLYGNEVLEVEITKIIRNKWY